ncbi:MAG: DHA2 family efflux MFS transporter permease subunit [Acidobacteriota bacterium]|nr:DHA2 family efflux MFS transporter permease subunit [Acidobacteriota bacterium]
MKQLFARARQNGETHPWLVAFTVMLAVFMEVLDTSVANVALPHISGNLSAGVDESTWVLTSYLVSNAIVLPLTGWLSSLFGRKRFYMTCVAIFTVSSLLCGLAPSLPWLVFFRIMQGAGGGALQPISQAVMLESFPKEKRGMAMAMFGVGVVMAPIIGPTLGGWLTDSYSWRWIFFINIPVGVISLILTFFLIYDPPFLERKKVGAVGIDYIGLGLLSVGLGFLQVVLDKGQREDWFESHFIVACAAVAVIGLLGALIWELNRKDPIVDFRLLKNRNFLLATLTMFMLGFVLYGSTALLPIFLQTLLGYTALLSGLVLSPGGFIVVLMLPLVGQLLTHFDARWLVICGVVIVASSLFHMATFNLDIDFHTAMMARIYQSAGMAFLFVPINVMAFYFIPKEKFNNATGIINLARNIGGSFGIANVVTLLARRQQFHQGILVSHMTPFDSAYQAIMNGSARVLFVAGSNSTDAQAQAHGMAYGILQRHAAMLAFGDVFWIMGLMFLTLIPLMLLMKKSRSRGGPPMAH